jgi:hypothetical protein
VKLRGIIIVSVTTWASWLALRLRTRSSIARPQGTTRGNVMCTKAGQDEAGGLEGNDLIRGGQGDDDFLTGDDGSDVVRAQQDDDEVCGNDQNDKLYGGQGDDNLGGGDVTSSYRGWNGDASGDENGNDFLKSRDHVSGNDYVDGNFDTDTCVIDAGDIVDDCELWLARRERPGSLREGGCY